VSRLVRVASSVVFAVIAVRAGLLHAEDGKAIRWHTNAEDAWQAMRDKDRPLLLFVTAEGCRFCQEMKAQTYADRKIRSEVEGAFVALSVEADVDVDEDWLAQIGVDSFPTTLIISPRSKLLERFEGFVEAKEMQPRLIKIAQEAKLDRAARIASKPASPKSEGDGDAKSLK